MTVGYLGAGKCWPTESEAIDAVYSAGNLTSIWPVTQNTVTYWFMMVKEGGVWNQKLMSIASGSGASSVLWTRPAPTNVTGTCTLDPSSDPVEQFTDGHIMGWLVVAAMAVAFGFKQMRRAAQ